MRKNTGGQPLGAKLVGNFVAQYAELAAFGECLPPALEVSSAADATARS